MRRALLAAAAGATVLVAVAPARANGRFPFSDQFVFSPNDPNLIVLRTTYGILPSHDNGATWGFVCEDALGLGPVSVEDPSIGLTENNSLIAGVSVGLNVSPDVGCNWSCQGGPLQGQAIVDVAVRPDAPSGAVALTRSYLPSDAGDYNIYAQTFQTTDNGATWSALGTPLPPQVLVATIDVTKTDPDRIYVSGVRGGGSKKTASLFVSKDKGATWTENVLPAAYFDPENEDSIYIGAVDPTNADRLYIRSAGLVTGGESRLTVVDLAADGTPTFTTAHLFEVEAGKGLTGEMLGLALSPDGSKIYIGSDEEGLWMASTSDMKFQKKSSIIVQCLATRGNELWACSAAVSGFIAGVSTDDGATFTAKLPLVGTLTGPIACDPNPQGAACNTDANSSPVRRRVRGILRHQQLQRAHRRLGREGPSGEQVVVVRCRPGRWRRGGHARGRVCPCWNRAPAKERQAMKGVWLSFVLLGASAGGAILPLGCSSTGSDAPRPTFTAEQLRDPTQCKSCHATHYADWSRSMHAYASEDPVFLAMNARGQRETGGKLGTFCVQCHAPVAVNDKKTTDGLEPRPASGLGEGRHLLLLPQHRLGRPESRECRRGPGQRPRDPRRDQRRAGQHGPRVGVFGAARRSATR